MNYRHEAMRIAGEKIGAGRSGERAIDVFNPYTKKRIGTVQVRGVSDDAFDLALNHVP